MVGSLEKIRYFARNSKILPRLLKNYFQLASGRHPLRTVEIALTYKCQINCKHCYAAEYKNKQLLLTLSHIKNIVDQCISQGAIHFLLTGGEPFLSKNLFPAIKYIKSRGAIVTLATNGIALTPETVKNLISHKVDLVEISMDFLDQVDHHKFRKIESKVNLWDVIEASNRAGLNTGISIFTQKTILANREIEKIIKKAKSKNIKVSICYPCSIGAWKNKEVLSKQDFAYLKQLKKRYKVSSCEDNSYLKKGCAAGIEKLYITAYGDITPCPLIPMKFGNIRQTPLKTILKNIRKTPPFNKTNRTCIPAIHPKILP